MFSTSRMLFKDGTLQIGTVESVDQGEKNPDAPAATRVLEGGPLTCQAIPCAITAEFEAPPTEQPAVDANKMGGLPCCASNLSALYQPWRLSSSYFMNVGLLGGH